jgi:magnesium-transporting ATPase (P-type)
VLGAPELFSLGPLAQTAEREAAAGHRVVAFGRADSLPHDGEPPRAQTLGLVVLSERLRPNARETVDWLHDQDVAVVVLSGDRPETIDAVAAAVGIRVERALDGGALPDDETELRRTVLEQPAVGRITPEGKKRVVEALRHGGRYVAMVGDGVNDVPALKAARLAIAQGSGSQMARSVSDVVLVKGDFAALPAMVEEGRKILRNLQRVTKLFVAKSAFAAFLILTIGITPTDYPFLPRHLTLAALLTVGLPGFFLALAPSTGAFRTRGFLYDVARFAAPAGTAAGLGVLAAYLAALNVGNLSEQNARTVATTTLILVALYLVLALEASSRRRGMAVSALCAGLVVLYALVLALPFARHFFALSVPGPGMVFLSLAGAAVTIGGLWLTDDRFVPWR